MYWLILSILSFIVTLSVMIFAPLIALFVGKDGELPKWLRWASTEDNPAIGDSLFHTNQMHWTKSYYLYALFWLWRNPAYGFDNYVGAVIPKGFFYESKGDELTTNSPLHEGWVYRKVRAPSYNDKIVSYWQFYLVKRLTKTKCLKLNIGHKLWGNIQAGQVRSLVCTINPFTKYN